MLTKYGGTEIYPKATQGTLARGRMFSVEDGILSGAGATADVGFGLVLLKSNRQAILLSPVICCATWMEPL
jgi:hypothetical protein